MNKKNYIAPEVEILRIFLASTPVGASGSGNLGNFEDGGILE